MARLLLVILTVGVISLKIMAQDDPRPEVRIVNHFVWYPSSASTLGVAGYVNEPDILHGGVRGFSVGGVAARNKTKTWWLEIMGGGLATQKRLEFAIDLRGQIKLAKLGNATLWGEQLKLINSNRTLLAGSITKVFIKCFKIGVESDTWLQKIGNTTGIGPGVGVILNPHTQVWTAYQFGFSKQRDIARTYLIFNW